MRLAFIAPGMLPLPSIRGGGIEGSVDGIIPIISKYYKLTVISIKDPELPEQEVNQGVEYIRFSAKNYRNHVSNYLRQTKPFDLIHVFNRPRNVPVYKKASPASRIVVSLHNEVFCPGMLPEKEGIECINCVDKIITVSNYLAGTVYRRFPQAKDKLKTIYSGVDINHYRPVWEVKDRRAALRKKYGLTNKKVIIFVGRVLPQKGPHVLIQAFKLLLPKNPEAALVIVGSPWYSDNSPTDYVRQLQKMSRPVRDKIIFTNYIPQSSLPDYYVMGDVFVCPSQWQEPAGRIHYEAMAAGLPIITTNRGGIPEVVTHLYNGIIIKDYKNPAAFAKALDTVFSDPGRAQKLARNGRETAEKRFSFQRMAQDYMKVYEQCKILPNSLMKPQGVTGCGC